MIFLFRELENSIACHLDLRDKKKVSLTKSRKTKKNLFHVLFISYDVKRNEK